MTVNSSVECNQIQPLLEAYSLDALSKEEQRRVTLHLETCPDCRAIASEYADMSTQLSELIAGISPHVAPAGLKERVLDNLESRNTNQLIMAQDISAIAPESTPVRELLNAHHMGRWFRLAFALITLLLALSLIWSVRLNVTLARERALLAEYADLVDQQEIVLEVIDSDNSVRRLLLPVADFPSRPYGKVFSRTDMNHVVAMAARLPELPPGEAYHLWLSQEGKTKLTGIMNVNSDGFGLLVFDEDNDNPQFDSALVTLQPIGSETPSDDVIIRWEATP